MQSVLSPIVGRLSDTLDRKYLAAVPPLIAFAGAVVSAKATSMNMLIGGGILIGITLSTISIVQAIPSEILPLKYRPLAQGFAGMGGTVGGVVGALSAGAVTNINTGGWRWIFWIQVLQAVLGLRARNCPILITDIRLFSTPYPPSVSLLSTTLPRIPGTRISHGAMSSGHVIRSDRSSLSPARCSPYSL